MNIIELLNKPDAVRNVSWKALHEAVREFPYSQHLRLITARKAKLENNMDLQILLELAATYSPSRRFLYEYLAQPEVRAENTTENISVEPIAPENILPEEPTTPETPIISPSLTTTTPQSTTSDTPMNNETPINIPTDEILLENETPNIVENEVFIENETPNIVENEAFIENETPNIVENEAFVPQSNTNAVTNEVFASESVAANNEIAADNAAIEVAEDKITPSEPEQALTDTADTPIATATAADTSSFGSWLALLGGVSLPKPAPIEKLPLPIPEDEHEDLEDEHAENEVRSLAEKSVAATSEIISETLAKLLEMQGKYAKALQMYQQLSVKHPEKASIFAERIAALAQKIGK